MKSFFIRIAPAIAFVCLVSSCATATPTEELVLPPEPTLPHIQQAGPQMETDGLLVYRGQGFSFQYPANARIEIVSPTLPATSEIHIIGPEVSIKPGDADWVYSGPGYEMSVQTFDNPDALDAEAWGRAYLLETWEERMKQGPSPGGIPVSEDGEIDEDLVGTSIVAGQPAFWIELFGGDSAIFVYYLASGHQILTFSFRDYPLPNQPLNDLQQGIHMLIMGTLRWHSE